MVIQDFKKYRTISKILNQTFGQATNAARTRTESVLLKVIEEGLMSVKFVMVVNTESDATARAMLPRWTNEALSRIEVALQALRDEYKKETGQTLVVKLKTDTMQDSLEFTSYSIYNPKKTAIFRYMGYATCK